MSRAIVKLSVRFLATLLSVLMIVTMIPITTLQAFATIPEQPENFTFTVNDGENAIEGATVTLAGTENCPGFEMNATTNAEGVATFEKAEMISKLATNATEEYVNFGVTVEKDGYQTYQVEKTGVPVASGMDGNTEVLLNADDPLTATVLVTVTGNATVEINGVEQTFVTVPVGTEVPVKITPNENSYIESLSVGGNTVTVAKGEAYEDVIIADTDVAIVATVVDQFKVYAPPSEGGKITLNGSNESSILVSESTKVTVNVTADESYQISYIAINGQDQTLDSKESFSKEIIVNAYTEVTVGFARIYTITISHNNDGTVVTTPANTGGSVSVLQGSTIKLIADPNDNYRVSEVTIDEVPVEDVPDVNYGPDDKYIKELTANGDYKVVVTFAPNRYNVTNKQTENGSVDIGAPLVDYDGSSYIVVTPDNGYSVTSVKVNGVDISEYDTNENGGVIFTIVNITEDQEIEATFAPTKKSYIDVTELFNEGSAIYTDGMTYVYAKDGKPVFNTKHKGILLYGKNNKLLAGGKNNKSVTLRTSVEIAKIELMYKDDEEMAVMPHELVAVSSDSTLNIIIDKKATKSDFVLEGANEYGFFNSDFTAKLVSDEGKYVSGVASVEYFVTNKNLTGEYDQIAETDKTEFGIAYTYTDDKTVNKSETFDIPVTASKNDSDTVYIWAKITDRAGNVETIKSKPIKVGVTSPQLVSVDISGTKPEDAEDGYFNTTRTATITIVDRASAFDETKANNGIQITAKNFSDEYIYLYKPSMITWEHNGDTHIATVVFETNANYTWSIDYTNKADLALDKTGVAESGNNLYKFTIDDKSPLQENPSNVAISIDEDNTWNKLVATLTFGIWRKYSITATATAFDGISGIKDILYYKSEGNAPLSADELEVLYTEGKFVAEPYTVNAGEQKEVDEKFVIYARITDKSGNTCYISTDGLIYDMSASVISIVPEKPHSNQFYNKDLNVNITVNESLEGKKAYSGIKTVDYMVEKDGKVTQGGNLFTYNAENPKYDELKSDWTGTITIEAKDNSSDNVEITVIVYDNAGNISTKTEKVLINVDEIEATITLDGEPTTIDNDCGYYKMTERVAEIKIKDRASAFNEESANSGVKFVDDNGNEVDIPYQISEWTHDGNYHTATVTFSGNRNYRWFYSYTNLAGNSLDFDNKVNTGDSKTPFVFTLDTEAPTGSISINDNTWTSLLEVLTFGIWNDEKLDVHATSNDNLSPFTVEYYKATNSDVINDRLNEDNQIKALSESELDTLYANGEFKEYTDFSVDSDELFVVYIRITDYAGNYTYISSDAAIVDDKDPINIDITPEAPNANDIYGLEYQEGIDVAVTVTDPKPSSGIQHIEYKVVKNEDFDNPVQTGVIYTADTTATKYEITDTITDNITLKFDEGDSYNAVLYVTAVDNAGNSHTSNKSLDIDMVKPVIDVSFDEVEPNQIIDGIGYFATQRVATVKITERADHFNKTDATDEIVINAFNANGDVIQKPYKISDWVTTESLTNPNEDVHTATITFGCNEDEVKQDANFTFFVSYTDMAGNQNNGVNDVACITPNYFTVDTQAPTGNIKATTTEGREEEWNTLIESLTFGIWENSSITATATAEDEIAGVDKILYYKSESENALSVDELEAFYAEGEFVSEPYTVNADELKYVDEKFAVYARLTDKSGNTCYISTNGMIYDMSASIITIEPEAPHSNQFYNKDLDVAIKVSEVIEGKKAYSGINKIDYKVVRDGNVTKEDNLFTYDATNPKYDDLVHEWNDTITIIAEENSSDNVEITVTVYDNAGNISTKTEEVAINVDDIEATITLDGEPTTIDNYRGYYKMTKRTAEIKIKDRASAFNVESANTGVKFVDDNGNKVDIPYQISEWEHEGNLHTATVTFSGNRKYTWSYQYTNLAGNSLDFPTNVDTVDSKTPFIFTLDTKAPTGSISINDNTWSKLLTVLTFGIWNNQKLDVTATVNDNLSPVTVEYYKVSNDAVINDRLNDEGDKFMPLSEAELDVLYANGEFKKYSDFTIDNNEMFVVYIRITDYAGNYTYISSDAAILDKNGEMNIEITPESPNANNIYGLNYQDGIDVAVKVTDPKPSSGIQYVEYKVVKKNDDNNPVQTGRIYTADAGVKYKVTDTIKGNITLNFNEGDSYIAELFVTAVDNAGNYCTSSKLLDIDMVKPVIDVSFNALKPNQIIDDRGYFAGQRVATVKITERSDHFDPAVATEGIDIRAFNAKGEVVNDVYQISGWDTTTSLTNPNEDIHTATITFGDNKVDKDANFSFLVSYTDKADNKNHDVNDEDCVTPNYFTVDTQAPTGTIKSRTDEGRVDEWDTLRDTLTFGIWSQRGIGVTATSTDVTSDPNRNKVEYYKVTATSAKDGTTALTKDNLGSVTTWQPFSSLRVDKDEQFTVYLKITDLAGNYTYISTNGLIVDHNAPLPETIAPEVTITPQQPVNGIYNKDVKVDIKVADPLVGGTYSGLKKVWYEVRNMGAVTQSGTLLEFTNASPKQEELIQSDNYSIVVDSRLNNSNDVQVIVYAQDNSLNGSDRAINMKIDITKPTILVSYDNNSPNRGADSNIFFNSDRTATVVVTERNFNGADVIEKITNTDGVMPTITDFTLSKPGTGNQDDTQWTAKIIYSADGDYTFDIDYTDMANNASDAETYAEGSVSPNAFTIDKTKPVINVSYDNNDAQNGNYYKAVRTATVVITEHNFNADKVKITHTATDDGTELTKPVVSGWSSNGNNHVATIKYDKDAKYTFDITVSDKAGNECADYDAETFFVDTTVPNLQITGIKDKSANKGNIIPVITYTDTNYDSKNVSITLTGARREGVELDGAYTDIHNGCTFKFNNFPRQKEVDDIYTLSAKLTDKAGNTAEKTITFSVNRFGSTYALNEDAKELDGTYVKDAGDIVITETNVDELSNIKVTLFKDGASRVLNENADYRVDVAGGNGQWYHYTYTVFSKNFESDGVYSLTVESDDKAGNNAKNDQDTKDTAINFGVDNTLPIINVENLQSKTTYALDKLTVKMSIQDNLKLKKVIVDLDGKEYKVWTADELEEIVKNGGNFTFDISGDSTEAHNLVVYAIDAAGNGEKISDTELPANAEAIENFYVTTNLWIRYYTNKPLFFGSIAGVIIFASLIVFLVVYKKKKNK